jgi:hypothetical protein
VVGRGGVIRTPDPLLPKNVIASAAASKSFMRALGAENGHAEENPRVVGRFLKVPTFRPSKQRPDLPAVRNSGYVPTFDGRKAG